MSVEPRTSNVKYTTLVEPEKILLPLLHIKLGLIKNFVKALDKEGGVFKHLRELFPQLIEAKLKERIFVGPQIRKLICVSFSEIKFNQKELATWKSIVKVVKGFLGTKKMKIM
ncbi:hypothetical protein AVEN_51894-1 [Araneus ventricosus]|uniref:Uncharacterized protein n=1 Tax=Araneus ventricosus TaxID=182803 RepID=A0A4Y2VPL5_ARAVE|nr:hypothetical protein AVEN_51894-1 [Araneus ventricosus]